MIVKERRTEQFRTQVATLWDEGVSTKEIGRRLGVTKNVIVGLRSRMHLPARPSPIRYSADGERVVRRKPALTPPPQRLLPPPLLDRVQWLRWFQRCPLDSRRLLARAVHQADCPGRTGGMWTCRCGATQPGGSGSEPVIAPLVLIAPTAARQRPPPERPARPLPPGVLRSGNACCFPIGAPGKPGFRYCDAPVAVPRGSYCEECSKKVYVRRRREEEEQPLFAVA